MEDYSFSFPSLKRRNDEKEQIEKANFLYNVQNKLTTFNDKAQKLINIFRWSQNNRQAGWLVNRSIFQKLKIMEG